MREKELSFLGFPGYIAREDGTIVKPNGDLIVAPQPSGQVTLKKALREYKSIMLNRVIAECFVENPHGYTNVAALNGNKYDCRAENLVWKATKTRVTAANTRKMYGDVVFWHSLGLNIRQIALKSGATKKFIEESIEKFEAEVAELQGSDT